jgi:hypothetical protein
MDGVVKARNVLCHEIGGGVPALPWKSVYRAGRHHIGKLAHRIGDAAPYRRDVVIILRRQLLGASTLSSSAFSVIADRGAVQSKDG